MLTRLYIENIAVIEKTEVNFGNGLNIITGETGAGKSIVIDSLCAVLGRRVSKDVVRAGTNKAFVSATFSELTEETINFIKDQGFELDENNEIILQRELMLSQKSIARINGRPAPISVIKALGEKLVNIHGQHENYGLLSQETHIKIIDDFGNLGKYVQCYKDIYEKLKLLKQKLNEMKVDESEKARKIDLLKYEISELESLNLVPGEIEQLEKEKSYLENNEKITMSIEKAKQYLMGDDDFVGAVSLLESANYEIQKIKDLYSEVENLAPRVQDLFYELSDCQQELSNLCCDQDNFKERLNFVEERLSLILNLSRKYGRTEEDMFSYLDNAKNELSLLNNSDEKAKELQEEFNMLLSKAKTLAYNLSSKRMKVVSQFLNAVKQELIFLDMPKVKLEVSHKTCNLRSNGCDELEFLISTNPGQPPRPLSKIASGGELSRLMLAIKNVLSRINDADTLIFDEIDTGISGSAAQKVGLKLQDLSRSRQIICITHLAQIASLADEHFSIKKVIYNGETFTKVFKLNFEKRKEEIARIIGGSDITELTIKNAEEMIISGRRK